VGDLADPSGWQEREAHQSPRRVEADCFNQADEPSVLAAEAGDDRARDGLRPTHPRLSGKQHSRGALDFEPPCAGHVDFDQIDRHVPIVACFAPAGIAGNTERVRSSRARAISKYRVRVRPD
jgi:hypothetical protein